MNGHMSINHSMSTPPIEQFKSLQFINAYGISRNQPVHFLSNQFHQDADLVYHDWRDATQDYITAYQHDQDLVPQLHAGIKALVKAASTSSDEDVYHFLEEQDVNCNLMVGPQGVKTWLRELERFVAAHAKRN